jgi:hypothetical protein
VSDDDGGGIRAAAGFDAPAVVVGTGSTLYAVALMNETTGQVDAVQPLDADLEPAGGCLDAATVNVPFAFHLDANDGEALLFRVEEDSDEPELQLRDRGGIRWDAPLEVAIAPPGLLGERLAVVRRELFRAPEPRARAGRQDDPRDHEPVRPPNERERNRAIVAHRARRPRPNPLTAFGVDRGAGAAETTPVSPGPDSVSAGSAVIGEAAVSFSFASRQSANSLVRSFDTSGRSPRDICAAAPVIVMSERMRTVVPSSPAGSSHDSTFAFATPLPRCSVPLPDSFARCPMSSFSSITTVPLNAICTGPNFTWTSPFQVRSSTISVSSAPGMQGAISSTSWMNAHKRSTGVRTVKLSSISILGKRTPAV